MNRAEWLEERKKGIGASEAAASRAAIAETKKKHRGSLREVPGAQFNITITVIGREE